MKRRTFLKGALIAPIAARLAGKRKAKADAVAQTEKANVLGLLPDSQVTITAVADGQWDSADVWSGGRLPTDGDTVLVPAGRIVLYDHAGIERLSGVRVDGVLEFDPTADTRLIVETIVVNEGGKLVIGSKVSPISNSAEIVFLDSGAFDYMKMRRGLIALGMVSIYGDSCPPPDRQEAITNDGKTRPTGIDRKVTLRSENPLLVTATGAPSDFPFSRRGHIMLMHQADHELGYFSCVGLGRTNKDAPISTTNPRGRYPLHFHRTGFDKEIEVTGVVVEDSPGWGIVNHSSYVKAKDCLAYNIMGAGFVTEAGNERGSFESCVAIYIRGSGDKGGSGNTPGVPHQLVNEARKGIGDYGHLGDGFWLQGPYVACQDCISNGARFAGFNVFNNGFKEPDTGEIALNLSRNITLAEQTNNVALNSEFGAITTWLHAAGSKFTNFTATRCKVGQFSNQSVCELHNPTFTDCWRGHDGGSDYGGPSRVYGGTFQRCEDAGIYLGTTRWLSGHSIAEGPFTFADNGIDIRVHQADPGITELDNIGNARMKWTWITSGSVDVRMRLFYQESQREFYLDSKRAYMRVQHPNAKPWGSGEYAGKTNQQIFDETGKKPLGALIPIGAIDRVEYWIEP